MISLLDSLGNPVLLIISLSLLTKAAAEGLTTTSSSTVEFPFVWSIWVSLQAEEESNYFS